MIKEELLNIPKEQRRELQRVIDHLLEEGKISMSRKGKLGHAPAQAAGFGRLRPANTMARSSKVVRCHMAASW